MKLFLLAFTFFASLMVSSAQNVQWADTLIAVSQQKYRKAYAPKEVLGTPNVTPDFGLSKCAWTIPSKTVNNANQWITVGYRTPMYIQQVMVNENIHPGAITKIEVLDADMKGKIIYAYHAPAPLSYEGRTLVHSFKKTSFKVKYVRVYMNNYKYAYNERYQIDAIGISDSIFPYRVTINLPKQFNINEVPENLGDNINSSVNEMAPIISPDGTKLFYTRNFHPENIGKRRKQDVWYSELDSNYQFKKAVNIGAPINNKYANFVTAITPDGNTLLCGNTYLASGKMEPGLSLSHKSGSKWSFPVAIDVHNYYNNGKQGSFSLSSSGKILLLALQRFDSFGYTDIYVSFLNEDETWSAPKNIGKQINTNSNEVSPFLAADEETLYFSTDGLPGYGSNDMFMARRLDSTWTKWSDPINLGQNINTPEWDAYFTIPASGEYAYFTSSNNSIGFEDIFRIKLPNALKPKTVIMVSGKVINSKTNDPIGAKISYESLPEGIELGIARSDPKTGAYKIALPAGKVYGFSAHANNFIAVNQNIDLTNAWQYKEINQDLTLVPIEKNVIIRINNIFFETGKFALLKNSFPELNRLCTILEENPKIKIQVNGHTDNTGYESKNRILSLQRASAVRDYLQTKGINPKRLKTKGCGQAKPVASNKTEDGKQQNRRVEFKILSK